MTSLTDTSPIDAPFAAITLRGVGLAMAQRIVVRHGGRIWGGGHSGRGGMKLALQLLVVEDSEADAELIARHLIKGGLTVDMQRVQTERDFVSALQRRKSDLILSDFSLPQFDGLRALELALAHSPETPFIYVSGTIGEERAIEALRRGAIDYVLKSNLARLPSAVERALREAELRAAKLRSERRQHAQGLRLQRLTRTYQMLSSTSSAILRLRSREELLDEVCRMGVHQGGYTRVAINLADPATSMLRPRARADAESALEGNTADPAGQDLDQEAALAERATRSGVPAVLNDLGDSQPTVRNYRALAALPLRIDGAAIGAITFFSGQSDVFDQAEINVLLELTANLSFALQYLDKDEAVHFLSNFDSLTGLAKRPLFCQRLARGLSADAADSGGRTVVVFDIQKLGAINDTLGRYAGDRLIEKIAARARQSFADSDCVGYFGGGTFALMLKSEGKNADTGRFLQNAAAQLFVEPFNIDGQELRPAIRSGVAFYPSDASGADALVQNAEAALHAAREDNEKYMLYGLITERPTSRSLALEARLAGALDRQEFLLHYQPKVNIESGRIEGLEALLRWQDSQDGLVAPSIFVPLLERSGAIVDVGEWILLQAVRDIRNWTAAGLTEGSSRRERLAIAAAEAGLRRSRVVRTLSPSSNKRRGSISRSRKAC